MMVSFDLMFPRIVEESEVGPQYILLKSEETVK
jgi:hypothetical protein